ncbi:hypothetical protein HLB44_12630 [Aquincola sp. S2]|uniref:DUF7694 domain-containing protein n=1 Tax=Pseudaquabacterium terrae TaxID=2732868 RepID=A0ABX2EGY0_9BURK|nr:hypothetical protein [Aquabacterium terrae]NRF67831.1 hypothetical protein [Aquabacterium terrae]
MNPIEFADSIRQQLRTDGYSVLRGGAADGELLDGRYWFCWSRTGIEDAEIGPPCESELAAWNGALQHRLSSSSIGPHGSPWGQPSPMGNFYAIGSPKESLGIEQDARSPRTPLAAALQKEESLRQQTVYTNETYQVRVSVVRAPLGAQYGDVAWLSIKRHDDAAVHDWNDVQEIKSRIIGAEHEGFEVYPADSLTVDTANEHHLYVFLNSKVRLPIGYRLHQAMCGQAAAVVRAEDELSSLVLTRHPQQNSTGANRLSVSGAARR